MFFFGILSLSDLMDTSTSIYIEHVLSNAIIPAYLYELYLLFEVAIYAESDGWALWGKSLPVFRTIEAKAYYRKHKRLTDTE